MSRDERIRWKQQMLVVLNRWQWGLLEGYSTKEFGVDGDVEVWCCGQHQDCNVWLCLGLPDCPMWIGDDGNFDCKGETLDLYIAEHVNKEHTQ